MRTTILILISLLGCLKNKGNLEFKNKILIETEYLINEIEKEEPSLDVIKILLQQGAKPQEKDKYGKNALEYLGKEFKLNKKNRELHIQILVLLINNLILNFLEFLNVDNFNLEDQLKDIKNIEMATIKMENLLNLESKKYNKMEVKETIQQLALLYFIINELPLELLEKLLENFVENSYIKLHFVNDDISKGGKPCCLPIFN